MSKVSIVIPTRERAEYLHYSIQTALAIKDPDIEILVNDNCSQDSTRAVVQAFDDPRLVYFNTGRRVSMRSNYNEAIGNSSGEYVIFFGDDDGIVPGQFPFLRAILEEYQPDGVSWIRGTYGWPEDARNKKLGGMRFRKDSLFGKPYRYDPKARNLRALMDGRISDTFPVTPNIYHGCVSRAYLERIAPELGLYLNSVIPDVNFEYRATLAGGNFVHVDHMFSVNGYAKKSTGGGHAGHKADDPKADTAKTFEIENETDAYNDVFNHARFVPLAFFATMETILDRGDFDVGKPDYAGWYTYILQAAAKQVNPYEGVKIILQEHAQQAGTTDILAPMLDRLPPVRRSFEENLDRISQVLNSTRLDVGDSDGENTILSAVSTCDMLLNRAYAQVQRGEMSSRRAWSDLKTRAGAKARGSRV